MKILNSIQRSSTLEILQAVIRSSYEGSVFLPEMVTHFFNSFDFGSKWLTPEVRDDQTDLPKSYPLTIAYPEIPPNSSLLLKHKIARMPQNDRALAIMHFYNLYLRSYHIIKEALDLLPSICKLCPLFHKLNEGISYSVSELDTFIKNDDHCMLELCIEKFGLLDGLASLQSLLNEVFDDVRKYGQDISDDMKTIDGIVHDVPNILHNMMSSCDTFLRLYLNGMVVPIFMATQNVLKQGSIIEGSIYDYMYHVKEALFNQQFAAKDEKKNKFLKNVTGSCTDPTTNPKNNGSDETLPHLSSTEMLICSEGMMHDFREICFRTHFILNKINNVIRNFESHIGKVLRFVEEVAICPMEDFREFILEKLTNYKMSNDS